MDTKQVISIILRKWWLIVISAAIAGGTAFYLNYYVIPPVYQATASIYVKDINLNSSEYGIAYDQLLVNTQLIADYTELMKSRAIGKAVVEDLRLTEYTYDDIVNMISISSKNDTRIIEIAVNNTDPIFAMNVANSLARVFSEKAVQLMNVVNVNLIDAAELPEYPVGPKKLRNTVMSVFAALILMAGILVTVKYFDNTIDTSEDVEKRLGLAVLGTIPEFKMK